MLGGDLMGQTQIAYSRNHHSNPVPFNHPLDLHVAEWGMQVLLHLISMPKSFEIRLVYLGKRIAMLNAPMLSIGLARSTNSGGV